MTTTGLKKLLDHLGGPTDGQLLSCFIATGDEAAFAALVRRHGPMVLGVCRRLLGNWHDAEDAFQATFLVLARRAGSVVKRESVGSWLHGVACRTALQAASANARRRAKERQVEHMPHPGVPPEVPRDWLPLLDWEPGRLPELYREAVVLCDLEGRTRGEAARLLGLPEGTLSGRLTTARRLLARRLARYGLAPAGGVAAALSAGRASARVPAALVWSTARAAALVAAGQLAAAPGPAVVLMRGVIRTMFLTRLKLTAAVAVVVASLAAGGLVYQAGGIAGPAQAAPEGGKPATELEALRRENELLKLNLEVVLEKVRTQGEELRALRGRQAEAGPGGPGPGAGMAMRGSMAGMGSGPGPGMMMMRGMGPGAGMGPMGPMGPGGGPLGPMGSGMGPGGGGRRGAAPADPLEEAESAVKALREAPDEETKQRATNSLERALKRLKERAKKGANEGSSAKP
jgi:DNA-directed RNA polymerase specialized sigma24 family protein